MLNLLFNYQALCLSSSNCLFPLNRAGRFRAYVVYHAIDPADFANNSAADRLQNLEREARPIGGHPVLTFDRAYGDHLFICPLVSHHAHGLDRQKNGERLPELMLEARPLDLFADYVVGLLQETDLVLVYRAQDSDSQSGPWEWLAIDKYARQPQLPSDGANFILEEFA
jgi:hypothetical protein